RRIRWSFASVLKTFRQWSDIGEMREEGLGPRHRGEGLFRQAKYPMQEPTRAAGIDHKFPFELQRLAVALSLELHPVPLFSRIRKLDLVPISHAHSLGLARQIMIEIRAIPMRIGH